MLCLPWDSFLVSNDRPKIEQLFESSKTGLWKNRGCGENTPSQGVNNGSLDGRSGAIVDPHHPKGGW